MVRRPFLSKARILTILNTEGQTPNQIGHICLPIRYLAIGIRDSSPPLAKRSTKYIISVHLLTGGLMLRMKNIVAVACVASFLLFIVGCYETQYPPGSQDKAVVDPAYVGD